MNWAEIVNPELEKEYMLSCKSFISNRRTETEVFPEPKDTFAFTGWVQPSDVKLVIVNFKPELGIDDINRSIKDSLYSYLTDEEFDMVKVNNPSEWGKHGILYFPASLTWEKDNNHYEYWSDFGIHVLEQLKAPSHLFLGATEDREEIVSDNESVVVFSKELYNPKAIYTLLSDIKTHQRTGNAHQLDVDYSDCIDFKKVKNKYVDALKKGLYPDEVLKGCMKSKQEFLNAIHQWLPIHKSIHFLK